MKSELQVKIELSIFECDSLYKILGHISDTDMKDKFGLSPAQISVIHSFINSMPREDD